MNLKDIKNRIRNCTYKNWDFKVGSKGGECYLQVQFVAADNETGAVKTHHGRKWLISKHATESELVFTALKAVLTAEEHEAREQFKYFGRAIANPHININSLWRMCMETDSRA